MKYKHNIVGPRIKVKVLSPEEERTASGFYLNPSVDKLEDNEIGVVVQLGNLAYGNFKERWCELGDIVLFQKYAGKPKEETAPDGSLGYYRLLKDIDVIAVLEEESQNDRR